MCLRRSLELLQWVLNRYDLQVVDLQTRADSDARYSNRDDVESSGNGLVSVEAL